jgi:hypothetical protein
VIVRGAGAEPAALRSLLASQGEPSACDLLIAHPLYRVRPRAQQQMKVILHHGEGNHLDGEVLCEELQALEEPLASTWFAEQ